MPTRGDRVHDMSFLFGLMDFGIVTCGGWMGVMVA